MNEGWCMRRFGGRKGREKICNYYFSFKDICSYCKQNASGCQVVKDGLTRINLIILPEFGIIKETGL